MSRFYIQEVQPVRDEPMLAYQIMDRGSAGSHQLYPCPVATFTRESHAHKDLRKRNRAERSTS